MGLGDWLIATGQIKEMYAANPVPVLVMGIDNRPQWSEVFVFNPKILKRRTASKVQILVNGPGARPYVAGKQPDKWLWKPFGPTPGELYFHINELSFGKNRSSTILIEPNIKAKGNLNKAWPFERWQQLVNRKAGKFMQVGPIGTKWLENVERIVTPTFRHAAVVLKYAKCLVSSEGGLMHAAAALGVPAVILWSEFIDPSVTGYKDHINIRHADRTCGARLACPTCLASMQAITVDEVDAKLRSVLC